MTAKVLACHLKSPRVTLVVRVPQFENHCSRGNASKAIDRCSTAMVSRDLSRLRTNRAIMLCGNEPAVNACLRTEIHYFVSADYSIPLLHTLVWCDQFLWTTKRCNIERRYFISTFVTTVSKPFEQKLTVIWTLLESFVEFSTCIIKIRDQHFLGSYFFLWCPNCFATFFARACDNLGAIRSSYR